MIVREILTAAMALVDKDSREGNLKAFDALVTQGVEAVKPSAEQLMALGVNAAHANEQLIKGGQFSQEIFDQMTSIVEAFRAK